MSTNQLGNEANMEKVRSMMEQQVGQVNIGGALTHSVDIDYTSEFGNHYTGKVVFKKVNMKDIMRMGAIKSEILREAGVRDSRLVDNSVLFMATVLSTLQVVAVQRPAWLLKPENVEEADVLYHVYDKYEEWENSFRKPIPPEQTGAGEITNGTQRLDSSEQVGTGTD